MKLHTEAFSTLSPLPASFNTNLIGLTKRNRKQIIEISWKVE
jgi:hypothetical protein